MRAAVGTNNPFDTCSRVCPSPTSSPSASLGLSGAAGSFEEFDHTEGRAIVIGANPTEGHPVVGARIDQATLRGMKLVTVDPRRTELSDYGVLHLLAATGTNAAVMLGIAHVIHRDGLTKPDLVGGPHGRLRDAAGAAAAIHARDRRRDHGRSRRGSGTRRPHLR